jgi:hypothetical protein
MRRRSRQYSRFDQGFKDLRFKVKESHEIRTFELFNPVVTLARLCLLPSLDPTLMVLASPPEARDGSSLTPRGKNSAAGFSE